MKGDEFEVAAWNNGSHCQSGAGYAIRIRQIDRNRLFEPEWESVYIELPNGQDTDIKLSRSFWSRCPELKNREIGRWLVQEGLAPWSRRQPPRLIVRHLGGPAFRIVQAVPQETTAGYCQCYVAFLDILGFGDLVRRSDDDPELVGKLAGITGIGARPGRGGMKQTSLGNCPMQIRAFSDSIVIFTPTSNAGLKQPHPNPLAQLCFVVRYIHDRVLELETVLRGGVAIGNMYWDDSWSKHRFPHPASPPALTFGCGLIDAYRLEDKRGTPPRVVIQPQLVEQTRTNHAECYPFADSGRPLHEFFREDDPETHILDLLSPEVTRKRNEWMERFRGGFTVKWDPNSESEHNQTMDRVDIVIEAGLQSKEQSVRDKYEWLQRYAQQHMPNGRP